MQICVMYVNQNLHIRLKFHPNLYFVLYIKYDKGDKQKRLDAWIYSTYGDDRRCVQNYNWMTEWKKMGRSNRGSETSLKVTACGDVV